MINDIAKMIHRKAKEKGFWEKPRERATIMMLVVTELSEAVEADRAGRQIDHNALDMLDVSSWSEFPAMSTDLYLQGVKDTFEGELCDALMRLLDAIAFYNVDADRIIKNAMEYNRLRPDKNCKKY